VATLSRLLSLTLAFASSAPLAAHAGDDPISMAQEIIENGFVETFVSKMQGYAEAKALALADSSGVAVSRVTTAVKFLLPTQIEGESLYGAGIADFTVDGRADNTQRYLDDIKYFDASNSSRARDALKALLPTTVVDFIDQVENAQTNVIWAERRLGQARNVIVQKVTALRKRLAYAVDDLRVNVQLLARAEIPRPVARATTPVSVTAETPPLPRIQAEPGKLAYQQPLPPKPREDPRVAAKALIAELKADNHDPIIENKRATPLSTKIDISTLLVDLDAWAREEASRKEKLRLWRIQLAREERERQAELARLKVQEEEDKRAEEQYRREQRREELAKLKERRERRRERNARIAAQRGGYVTSMQSIDAQQVAMHQQAQMQMQFVQQQMIARMNYYYATAAGAALGPPGSQYPSAQPPTGGSHASQVYPNAGGTSPNSAGYSNYRDYANYMNGSREFLKSSAAVPEACDYGKVKLEKFDLTGFGEALKRKTRECEEHRTRNRPRLPPSQEAKVFDILNPGTSTSTRRTSDPSQSATSGSSK
jgi:hypothetical protein